MAKAFIPQVVTANRLRIGDVVYLGPGDDWVVDLARATVATDEAALSALEVKAAKSVDTQEVVGVYAIDVDAASGSPEARSVKERIRAARGPSV